MKNSDNNTESMITDLTQGNVVSQLLRFSFPLFVANLLQALYNLVDMVVVGHVIGGAGMSAVSIGGDLLHTLTFLAMGFASAGQVIIAQYVGQNNIPRIKKTIGTLFTFLFISSIVISVVCYILRYGILDLLNTPAESYDYTMDYLVTCIFGMPFIYGYNIVSAILRGMGDSKRPFYFVAIAAVTNTVLDIWFVSGLGMEVFGAALATVIGQALSCIISIIYLYRHRENFGFDFKLQSFAIDPQSLRPLIALGVPMAIQSAAVNISKIFITAWTNAFGVTYSALGGIYSKSCMILGVVSQAFVTAGSAMIGQNIGAKKYERVPYVLRTVFIINLAISVLLTVVVLAMPEAVFRMFTTDESVIAASSIVIAPMVLNFYGTATRTAGFSLINGSGNSRLNFVIAIIDGMISRIGFAALLGYLFKMGCQGFWFGDAIAGFVPITVAGWFYISGGWKKNSVTESTQ